MQDTLNEEGFFTVIDEDGNEKVCEMLFTFENAETGKNYIVYTDNTEDEDGSTRVYAGIYDPEGDDLMLKPLETEAEWATVEQLLAQIQEGMENSDELENSEG